MAALDRLPPEFTDRMRRQLGKESDLFFESCSLKGHTGIRLNTAKMAKEELPFLLSPVPWCANGYYTLESAPFSRYPCYFAGCYYIQEPSAMYPAGQLKIRPNDLVLDLCAAPGGKATELSLELKGKGLLIANDASAGRANALLKNLTQWGAPNTCITVETPQRLLEKCGCCFDKILVDAPCSGEGMFRRDPSAISSWVEKGPSFYAPLQREILSNAVQMLKPGGLLAYSTCTFSAEENEEVVADILEKFPSLHLKEPQLFEGFAPGIGEEPQRKCVRLYPHRVKGEGHFLALLEKSKEESPGQGDLYPLGRQEAANGRRDMPEAVSSFLDRLPEGFLSDYQYRQIDEQCLLVPPYHLPKLRYLRTGVLIGTYRSKRFEPSQDLAMLLSAKDFDTVLNFDVEDPRTIRYLRGETIALRQEERSRLSSEESGWVLVCAGGHALGWGKCSGANLKNKLYPGWRYR